MPRRPLCIEGSVSRGLWTPPRSGSGSAQPQRRGIQSLSRAQRARARGGLMFIAVRAGVRLLSPDFRLCALTHSCACKLAVRHAQAPHPRPPPAIQTSSHEARIHRAGCRAGWRAGCRAGRIAVACFIHPTLLWIALFTIEGSSSGHGPPGTVQSETFFHFF